MAASLMERMSKVGSTDHSAILSESVMFNDLDIIPTTIPALNIALSGVIDEGITPGITVFAAPSRHFKSSLGLICVAAYMQKHKDAICLFYDNEFGSPGAYFKSFGVDPNRVLHIPIDNLETFKYDIMKKLDELSRDDNVIIFVDSIGNLASKKEIDDAEAEKSAADMTRAKVLKSVFRMVTPKLSMKNIPMIVINHVYQEIGAMYPKTIMGGGTGPLLAAQNVIFVSRAQEKDAEGDISGYRFNLIVEKSRRVQEKKKIPLEVTYENGVNVWSGLFELAIEYGIIEAAKKGWYKRTCVDDDKSWRAKETECVEFWKPIFKNTNFVECIEQDFRLPENAMTNQAEDISDLLGDDDE